MSVTAKTASASSATTSRPLRATSDVHKPTATRNPLTLRLYKILSTRCDDPATREALQTVYELYRAPDDSRLHSSKGRVVNIETTDRSEDQDVPPTDALQLAGAGIAVRARKHLRYDAESKLAQESRTFLKAFQEVDQKLDALQGHIDEMQSRCAEAQTRLHQTNASCQSLLERASGLRAMRHTVIEKQFAVDCFLAHFTLTVEEAESLQSRDLHIDTQFFQVMRKAEAIRDDCRVLMNGDDGPNQIGIDIISETSHQLEMGYTKMLRWCSMEFRQFRRNAILEASPLLCEATKWLRKRPELFSEALSTLSDTRQAAVLSSFLDALTRGGPNGFPRPIEIHAHDPLRYVGDMLAWVHQSIAGEREFLDGLFDVKGDGRMVGSVRVFGKTEEEDWIQELMDKAFEKLRTPLKHRVRQTVRSQESCITSYKVANLLSFYNLTIRRTIGEEALLAMTLREITHEAYRAFQETIEAHARSLARAQLPDNQDLHPPPILSEHLQLLREIMQVYSSSLLGDESEEDERAGFSSVLDTMVDAATEMLANLSEARQRAKPAWDARVFMLNCLTSMIDVLESFTFTKYKVSAIQEDIDKRVLDLIEDHYIHILHDAALHECAQICANKPPDEPISRIGAMQPAPLETALRSFATWLSNSDVVHPTRFLHLLDQRLGSKVHHAALRKLAHSYALICEEVRKPENRYEAANTVLGSQRPFGQISVLRQILGLEENEVR